ncbi:MAG: hypothetical protein JJ992_24855, partial [Planctomycetes bacterium]|nr:hypothetical protein [Planctomycetota bacterium]
TDRLRGRFRLTSITFGRVATVCLFAALAYGSIWLALDLWNGHERSEVLGVPWRVLRLIANAGFLTCAGIAAAHVGRGAKR